MNRLIEFLTRKIQTLDADTRSLLGRIWTVIFFGGIIGSIAAARLADRYFGLADLMDTPLNFLIATPLLIIGFATWAYSIMQFKKFDGTPAPINPPAELVSTGLYRHMRNPIVTGLYLMILGVGIGLNSILISCALTPLIVLLMTAEIKLIEEPELEKRLGGPYLAYKRTTPMFFPRPWKR